MSTLQSNAANPSPEIILPPEPDAQHLRISRLPTGTLPDVGTQDFRLLNEIDAELVLGDIEEELRAEIAILAPEITGNDSEEIQAELLEREKSFFGKIFVAATNMADSQDGPVTLMFDLDLNLIHNKTVRPSFGLLVRELGNILGDRLEIGIITSRSPDADNDDDLRSQLAAPIFNIPGVASRLNDDFIMSSRNLERKDNPESELSLLDGNDTEAKIEAAKDILDPEVVQAIRDGRINLRSFYDSKLIVLQRLIPSHPDRGFIVIDDSPYANVIRRDSDSLKGIWTKGEILDPVMGRSFTEIPPSSNEIPMPLAA